MAVKIIQIELSEPVKPIRLRDALGCDVQALVRLRGEPLGWLYFRHNEVPVSRQEITSRVAQHFTWPIYEASLRHSLRAGEVLARQGQTLLAEAFQAGNTNPSPGPAMTVLVILAAKADLKHLPACLDALQKQTYPGADYEVCLVSLGPAWPEAEKAANEAGLVLFSGTEAFGRAVAAARGELVALTGPAGVSDGGWLAAVAQAADSASIVAVTGPLLPLELETPAQQEFASYARRPVGFARQYLYKQVFSIPPENFGLPLNAAFRRDFLLKQCADARFKAGFGLAQLLHLHYTALQEGFTVVAEPKAIVWERYPSALKEARRQLQDEGQSRLDYVKSAAAEELKSRQMLEMRLKTTIRSRVSLARSARKLKSLARR